MFIVDTDSIGSTQSPGQIEAWNGGAKFVVEDSPTGGAGGKGPARAVFKGLALAPSTMAGPELFAADVANATVDVFNKNFAPMSTPGEFKDPNLPKPGTRRSGSRCWAGRFTSATGSRTRPRPT